MESVRYLINAYFLRLPVPDFDYSQIRKAGKLHKGGSLNPSNTCQACLYLFDYAVSIAGEPIKGFGGVSQGAEILQELHDRIRGVRSYPLNASSKCRRGL